MKTLSKAAETRVLNSIREICNHVDDGMSPTRATIKVAQAEGLSRQFIELVSRGYNSGAVIHQRESHSSALDKFASVPLVDVEKVAEACYPEKVETTAQKAASAVDDCYSKPPRFCETPQLIKAASAAPVREPAPRIDPVRDAYWDRQRNERSLQAARNKYAKAQDDLLEGLAKLSEWTLRNMHRTGELLQVAQLKYGSVGAAVVDCLQHELQFYKVAWEAPKQPVRVLWDQAPWLHLQNCVKLAQSLTIEQKAFRAAEQELTTKIASWDTAFKAPQEVETDSPKWASFLGSLLTSRPTVAIGSRLAAPKETSDMLDDATMELDDPQHDNELRKIHAQTMLHDLITNDDVISGYDPSEVMDAYNEISSLTPRSSTQSAIMRPLLRKRLTQGALEPFEASEMANIEKTLGQSKMQPHQKIKEGAFRALRTQRLLAR